jgi:hypothetical protein
MIRELATYIENNSGYTIGTDLFARPLNTEDRVNASSLDLGGGDSDFYIADRNTQIVTLRTRNQSYFSGLAVATEIHDLLHRQYQLSLPVVSGVGDAYTAHVIVALSPPQYLGRNEAGHYEFITRFRVVTDKE